MSQLVYTIDEAIALCPKYSKAQLRQDCKLGRVQAVKRGKYWLINAESWNRWLLG